MELVFLLLIMVSNSQFIRASYFLIIEDNLIFCLFEGEIYFQSSLAAEIAWHERRKEWRGDRSNRPPRLTKEPVIRLVHVYVLLLI